MSNVERDCPCLICNKNRPDCECFKEERAILKEMTTKEKPELLLCPWCNSKPKYTHTKEFDNHYYGCSEVLCCVNPTLQNQYSSKENAAAAWNTRAPSPQPAPMDDEVVGLKIAHDDLFKECAKLREENDAIIHAATSQKGCDAVLEALETSTKVLTTIFDLVPNISEALKRQIAARIEINHETILSTHRKNTEKGE